MIYLFLVLIAIVLASIAQVLFKIGSRKAGFYGYYNRATIIGALMFLIVFVCSLIALQGLELKLFAALFSLSYAVVTLLSAVVIKERLTWQKVTAVILIILGTIVFYS
ncbi:MAG: EamA family transporter [Halobacteriota archaeon]